MIIGLTGRNGAGKGEVAKVLEEAGFHYYSLSDIIREEVRTTGKPVTRALLIETGTRLRENDGLGVLAEKTLKKLSTDRNYVIDSIRNPAEVKVLRRRDDFILFNVTAPRPVRFDRVKKRKRENDPKTLKDFIVMEEKEFQGSNPAGQQLLATEKLADAVIPNTTSLEELRELVKTKALKIARAQPRPSWDEYFMDIARMVAMRSNCVKRRVAALIVKDKRIISSGYNGTPRGVKNCNEGGCPRCNSFAKSGTGLEDCFCSHAEENAITQSAYHGMSIKDAILFTTFSPCLICTKMIINSGIGEVVYDAHYPLADTSLKLLKEAKVKTRKLS